jgi:predicted O-linked N-acetylglucosamine transferase (SPINDLY family)
VAFFIEPILRWHDHSKFEVWGILSHTWRDGKTDQLKGYCDHWLEAGGLSNEALAKKLRELEIDILIDLICHSQGSRVLTFARKPAPVQITMIGMQQTTGLDAMDYRITDAIMDPPGLTEAYHSEKLIHLPFAFVFQPHANTRPLSSLPALRNGYVTFGQFNNFAKAHPGVLQAWAQVMKRVPNSRFMAVVPKGTIFEAYMLEAGIAPERLIVKERQSESGYLQMHEEIDFALDCFPFAGLTVSAVAAWMGVPTLTISGNIPSARAGASLQHALGLDEFIVSNPEEFVERAVAIASDLPKLASIRASMRERCARQLTNTESFMKAYEESLRQAWRTWCQKPD